MSSPTSSQPHLLNLASLSASSFLPSFQPLADKKTNNLVTDEEVQKPTITQPDIMTPADRQELRDLQSNNATFVWFPKLPLEVRFMIWHEAILDYVPRLLGVQIQHPKPIETKTSSKENTTDVAKADDQEKEPQLLNFRGSNHHFLSLCRESRIEALKVLVPLHPSPNYRVANGQVTYFHPDHDIFWGLVDQEENWHDKDNRSFRFPIIDQSHKFFTTQKTFRRIATSWHVWWTYCCFHFELSLKKIKLLHDLGVEEVILIIGEEDLCARSDAMLVKPWLPTFLALDMHESPTQVFDVDNLFGSDYTYLDRWYQGEPEAELDWDYMNTQAMKRLKSDLADYKEQIKRDTEDGRILEEGDIVNVIDLEIMWKYYPDYKDFKLPSIRWLQITTGEEQQRLGLLDGIKIV